MKHGNLRYKWLIIVSLCTLCILSLLFTYNGIQTQPKNDIVSPNNVHATNPHPQTPIVQPTVVGVTHKRVKFAQNQKNLIYQRLIKQNNSPNQAQDNPKHYNEFSESIKNQRDQNKGHYHSNRGVHRNAKNRQKAMAEFAEGARLQRGLHRKVIRKHHFRQFGSKSFKEDYEYCNITDTPQIHNLLIANNDYLPELSKDKIDQLKKVRVEKPDPCNSNRNNPSHLDKRNIDLNDNLVPFINRCQVKTYKTQPDLFEYYGHSTTNIGYLHVFKSGGTTVIKTWDNVLKYLNKPVQSQKVHWRVWEDNRNNDNNNDNNRFPDLPHNYRWIKSRQHFYNNIFDKQYTFSFVRDPISRFLSSFFEYIIRGNDKVETNYMNRINDDNSDAIHLLNELAFIMEHRMKCEYKKKYEHGNNYSINSLNIYWDDHLIPQMHFLLNDKWDPYSLNYVGYVENIESDIYNILMEYYNIGKREFFSFEKFEGKFFEYSRSRHDKQYQQEYRKERHSGKTLTQKHLSVADLVLESNQLSDDMIKLICDLYWLDYLCMPFDIPKQCNLTELYLQHYGDHVVYNDCYQ